MLLRTRWAPDGRGRADVIATDGDLGPSVAHAIQCWDSTFVSRYEVTRIDGQTLSEDGDPIACRGRLATSAAPSVSEVPEEEDVENPIIVN